MCSVFWSRVHNIYPDTAGNEWPEVRPFQFTHFSDLIFWHFGLNGWEHYPCLLLFYFLIAHSGPPPGLYSTDLYQSAKTHDWLKESGTHPHSHPHTPSCKHILVHINTRNTTLLTFHLLCRSFFFLTHKQLNKRCTVPDKQIAWLINSWIKATVRLTVLGPDLPNSFLCVNCLTSRSGTTRLFLGRLVMNHDRTMLVYFLLKHRWLVGRTVLPKVSRANEEPTLKNTCLKKA